MDRPWIRASGNCTEHEIEAVIGSLKFDYFLACCTDRIVTAQGELLDKALEFRERIMELRLFGEAAELRFFRSMAGEQFSYRLADERLSSKNEYWLEAVQKLDIDTDHCPADNAQFGGRLLRTTGGSVYELPIADEDAIVLVRYIAYDDSGMANEADFRVKGFARMEDKNE